MNFVLYQKTNQKIMKNLLMIVVALQLILFAGCKAKELTPEQQRKAEEYTRKIEKPDFTFTASSAQTQRGRNINLTPDYQLKVSADTIRAYLPYFGRAYTAPMNTSESGIKFTSTDFEYRSVKKKNGQYEIIIEPKDIGNNIMLRGLFLRLSVGDSGYGNLDVSSTNRQNISFYGTIE